MNFLKLFPTFLLLSLLFVTSCSDTESGIKPVQVSPSEISTRTTDQEKVCALLDIYIELFAETPIDEYFDEEMFEIAEQTVITPGDLLIIDGHFEDGLDSIELDYAGFTAALNAVVALELTSGELYDFLVECDIPTPLWCIICNEKACLNSTVLSNLGFNSGHADWGIAFYIGVFIHCD